MKQIPVQQDYLNPTNAPAKFCSCSNDTKICVRFNTRCREAQVYVLKFGK